MQRLFRKTPRLNYLGIDLDVDIYERKVLFMKERRRFERFPLTLPTRMETISSGQKKVFEFESRDISACGVFIDTLGFFIEGTRIKVNLIARSERIRELTGCQSLIEAEGSVVRSTPKGVAISFDKECQILSLNDV